MVVSGAAKQAGEIDIKLLTVHNFYSVEGKFPAFIQLAILAAAAYSTGVNQPSDVCGRLPI